jgi:hypothetical protein
MWHIPDGGNPKLPLARAAMECKKLPFVMRLGQCLFDQGARMMLDQMIGTELLGFMRYQHAKAF